MSELQKDQLPEGGVLSLPKGWEVKRLGDVCEVIAGQSPQGKYYNDNADGLPFYQGKKEFGEKYIGEPVKWTTKVTKEAIENDILMSVRAPVGPINFSTQKICIGRGLASIRAGRLIDREFLFNFLLKHENEIVGNTGAVFNSINKTQIGEIRILLPPLSEQKRIVSILDKALAEIEKVKSNAQQNLKNAKELFESYLQGVFDTSTSSVTGGEGWEEKLLGDILAQPPRNGWSPPAKNQSETGIPVLTLSAVTGFIFISPMTCPLYSRGTINSTLLFFLLSQPSPTYQWGSDSETICLASLFDTLCAL